MGFLRVRHAAALMIALLTCGPQPLIAQPAPSTTAPIVAESAALPAALRAEFEERIAAHMAKHGVPGLSIAIGARGSLMWTRGFGVADVENDVKASEHTIYRLASISKPITAVAALQLVERGTLDLDVSVRAYVPEFPEKPYITTMRQLLCHQGGVRHYKFGEVDSTRHYADVVSAIVPFKNDDLVAEPGTKYIYSTYGYVLAGAAIEKASGKPFMQYVREMIAEPCGAVMLRADDSRAIIPHRARGYTKAADGTIRNCDLADTSNKIPGGGMSSRAEDLVLFALALSRGELLTRESIEAMWTAVPTSDGAATTYGLGWSIANVRGERRVDHSGGQPGTSTALVLYPDRQLAVAVMCNLERAPAMALAIDVAEMMAAAAEK